MPVDELHTQEFYGALVGLCQDHLHAKKYQLWGELRNIRVPGERLAAALWLADEMMSVLTLGKEKGIGTQKAKPSEKRNSGNGDGS